MLPPIECDIPEEVCCAVFFDIAYHLLTETYNALLDCWSDDACSSTPVHAYVTMGRGDDAIPDALSVALASFGVSPGTQRGGTTGPVQQLEGLYEITLRESGWPMAYEEGGQIVLPDPAVQNSLARHAFAHGERMWRRLAYLAGNRQAVPEGVSCSGAVLGRLTPLPPLGGMVGWKVDLTVKLGAL